ncbi:unnamed protein product [Urochloa decumbens]|uniref:F-box domain-containing protein n=1 Tax=Urochloa decumbens TaxID=240449 RepID=A0ABC9FVL4_9POAL
MEPSHRLATPAADPLTSLLGHLLDDILALLDVRDAVRTSTLSRAWRRRWESPPALSLSFLDRPGTPPEVVDSVLVRYAGRISRFSFHLDARSARRLDDWLLAFSRRGPPLLHLLLRAAVHLVFLELHNGKIPPLPEGFVGFPVLKELKLVRVTLPTNGGSQLGAIIGGSPLLGVLKLHHVVVENPGEEDCVIAGPNLHSLEIISRFLDDYDWEFGELPCLKDATIDLESYAYMSDFGEFLAGVAQVRKLTIYTHYKPFLGGNLLDTLEYTFLNLRSLFLCTHFRETHAILSTLCLLRSAPNLEELEIEIVGNQNQQQEIEANAEFQNTEWTNGLCANLEVVKMNGIGCSSNEMCFIELVLSKHGWKNSYQCRSHRHLVPGAVTGTDLPALTCNTSVPVKLTGTNMPFLVPAGYPSRH